MEAPEGKDAAGHCGISESSPCPHQPTPNQHLPMGGPHRHVRWGSQMQKAPSDVPSLVFPCPAVIIYFSVFDHVLLLLLSMGSKGGCFYLVKCYVLHFIVQKVIYK